MAGVKAGILNWPAERIPPSDIKSSPQGTELSFFQKKFLRIIQLEPWSGETHQGSLEVLDTGDWPQPNTWIDFLKLAQDRVRDRKPLDVYAKV